MEGRLPRIGAGGVQAGIVELETQATRIAEFQPGMISGLLQTSEYAREFLHLACGPVSYGQDEDEIDQMVANRCNGSRCCTSLPSRSRWSCSRVRYAHLSCRRRRWSASLTGCSPVIGLLTLELGIIPFEAAVLGSAPVSTVRQRLVSTTATFAALTESWWRSPQPAQSRHHGLPVRAITVTRCDGRDNTDVRYPPGRGG